jgi:arabinose-5-phosphate isomerase
LIHTDEQTLDRYKNAIGEETKKTLSAINPAYYEPAIKLIQEAEDKGNRIHVTGIGKPAHISQYYASRYRPPGPRPII